MKSWLLISCVCFHAAFLDLSSVGRVCHNSTAATTTLDEDDLPFSEMVLKFAEKVHLINYVL